MSESSTPAHGRWTGTILVGLLVAVASFLLVAPSSAGARSVSGARAEAPYPPVFCPTIAVSSTHPFPGQTITVTGQGFDGVQSLTLVLTPGNDVLGHVKTSAAGSFSTQVTIPTGVTGSRVIRAEGSGSDCPVDPISIEVSSNPTPASGSPLPFTGVDILTALAIALALVGIGLLLTRSGRRSHRGARHR